MSRFLSAQKDFLISIIVISRGKMLISYILAFGCLGHPKE
jgi:hypothetical protein